MSEKSDVVSLHPEGEGSSVVNVGSFLGLDEPVRVETAGGAVRVEWDWEAKATDKGQLAFFAQFLHVGGRLERWMRTCPRRYTSPNAPATRDILGALLLSVLGGHTRYRHVDELRHDAASLKVMGMERMPSSESVRRALVPVEEAEGLSWLREEMFQTWREALGFGWVLDIDTTIKPVYGRKQEGAKVGYNPRKPGRPSHAYHTYWMATARLCLDVEVESGDRHSAKYGMPRLWALLDGLPPEARPALVRGDSAYGQEKWLRGVEERGLRYLARVRMTKGTKETVKWLEHAGAEWKAAVDGWSVAEGKLQLMGWTQSRRIVVCRRWVDAPGDTPALLGLPNGEELALQAVRGDFEYCVLVTNTDWTGPALLDSYRERAGCENGFEELKNQWGWCGYTTRDLKRSRFMALVVALVYNWWVLFLRNADPQRRCREPITSRPLYLNAVGRMVESGRQCTIRVSPLHADAREACLQLVELSVFLTELATVPQLSAEGRWAILVRRAMHNTVMRPPVHPRLEHPP